MVFLDGDHSYLGVKADLAVLSGLLVKDTPVLCHDYRGPIPDPNITYEVPEPGRVEPETMWIGVQKACHEWEQAGYAHYLGTFGGSALYLTTDKCCGNRGGLRESRFCQFQDHLKKIYSKELISFGYPGHC
jgi:hypothetical protein